MATLTNVSLTSAATTHTSEATALRPSVVLLGRILFSGIFLMTAASHFSAKTVGYAAASGVPIANIAVPLSGIVSILGGLSILLGYKARLGAWLLVLFLLPVTFTMHKFWTVTDPMMFQVQIAMFMKNLSLVGGALLISQFGSGPFSVDARSR
jgi:putative oxidoreductase